MRTLLIFPPASDPAHPPAGLPALAAYLRQRGEEVVLFDLNVRAWNELLSSRTIGRLAEVLEARLEQLEAQPVLVQAQLGEYRAVAENLLSSEFLAEHVEDALRRLRDPATYASRRAYGEVTSIIKRALQFVSAAHFPSEWCPGGFSMRYKETRSADVLAAAFDRRENLFLPFLEGSLPLIREARPGLIGLSLNYYCQMIPAITLAAVIKQALPETPIVIGGGLVGFFAPEWHVLAPFRRLVDAWIPFEGEIPLYELTQALQTSEAHAAGVHMNSAAAAGIPGLLRFEDDTPAYHPQMAAPELSNLPPPSFEGLNLQDYLAPEPVLPVLASRGCYWARCAFCSHGQLYRGRFRSLRAADVLGLLDHLSDHYGARCFYFVDEAMPPPMALRLSTGIAGAHRLFSWFTETRFEGALDRDRLACMAQGGCRMLMFGLESSVARVLDHMEKGTRPEVAARILADCADVGIRSFVMFFTGFPTETREEAEQTIAFVAGAQDRIAHAAFTQFVLDRHAPVFRDPARYGVTEVLAYAGEDLNTWCRYRVEEGLSANEAAAIVAETRRDPRIRPPDRPYLVSRSHLAFLPARNSSDAAERDIDRIEISRGEATIPVRRPWLIPTIMTFNLDDVGSRLMEPLPAPLEPRPTHYVFNAEREKLIEVGPDGVNLLRTCNGTFAIDDILAAVGPGNRDATLQFLDELQARDFITWKGPS